MKYLFSLLLLLTSIALQAQNFIEPCKYGQPLVDALRNAYTPNNPLGYGPGRDILYSKIDNNGLQLSCIYTDFTVTLDPNADPSVSAFSGGINAEHVYPQSLGAGDEPARSDLHNIFPSKVNVNESRGSCPFGEIADSDTDQWFYLNTQLSSIPMTDIDLYSEKDEEDCVFEPREKVKGDIARAIFYFYAIYQPIADAAFFNLQKQTLYEWHLADPVDETEKRRDDLIAANQGNHNPFIVDASLVQRAYFEADASFPDGDPNCVVTAISEWSQADWATIASNFVREEVLIEATKNTGKVQLFDLYGRLIREQLLKSETRLQVSDLPQGVYILQIQSEGLGKVLRVYKK
ncbi:MAG: endonuclease [Chitinophagales bacterium]